MDNFQHLDRPTDGQMVVLAHLSHGLAQKQIAAELGITESAVKARLLGVRVKLGAKTTAQAVAKALRAGLME